MGRITLGLVAAVREDAAMRMAAELGLLLVIGVFLGVTGPYGTAREPTLAKYTFWLFIIGAGGLIGIIVETALRRWIGKDWIRVITTAGAMTPPITILVIGAMNMVLGHDHGLSLALFLHLLWQVFVISLGVMVLRMLVRRPPRRIV